MKFAAVRCLRTIERPARELQGLNSRRGDDMAELTEWDTYYVIVGSAAGGLIGLQFVVMTLIAERPPLRAAEAGAAFATPTIVHFGVVLLLSAVLRAPWASDHPRCSSLGSHRPRWRSVCRHRGSAHARANRLPPTVRGLVVSRFVAVGGVRNASAIGICGKLVPARGSVCHWSG